MDTETVSVTKDNAPRFSAVLDGHVESYFLRANHPTERLAIWLKATVLRRANGTHVAEAWCVVFAPGTSRGAKATVELDRARFEGETLDIDVAGCRFRLGPTGGTTSGRIEDIEWDLAFEVVPGMGGPMCVLPSRKMLDRQITKTKLLTPSPVLRFRGVYSRDGVKVAVQDWLGMQGHNWGRQHGYLYAWGQCVFPGADGEPVAVCEGFSSRVKLGPVMTPVLSSLVVRRGAVEYRFDQVFSVWKHKGTIGDLEWRLQASSPQGDVALWMKAEPSEVACLGYYNPDDTLAYCLNSKTSRCVLRVNPIDDEGFELVSAHGAALEILTRIPDPRFPNPI